jgi:hypothetical protein
VREEWQLHHLQGSRGSHQASKDNGKKGEDAEDGEDGVDLSCVVCLPKPWIWVMLVVDHCVCDRNDTKTKLFV